MTNIVYNRSGIPFDIDAIATDLNGKADTDLTNITDTGYIKMASASMPGGAAISLTLGASGTQYTAPADGWFTCVLSVGTGVFNFYNVTSNLGIMFAATQNQVVKGFVPCLSGQKVALQYTAQSTSTYTTLRFIYAKGSESEVQ